MKTEYFTPDYLGKVVSSFTGETGEWQYTISEEGEKEDIEYIGLNVIDIGENEDVRDFIEDSISDAFAMADYWEYRMLDDPDGKDPEYGPARMAEFHWNEEGVL